MRRALVPALAVLALSACGSGGTATLSPTQQVRAAATKTTSGSSKLDLSIESKAGGQDITFTGTGAFRYAAGTAEGSMTLSVVGQELEERIVGGNLYLKVPSQEGFYKLAVTDLVGTQLADSSNPASSAELLAVIDGVKKAGSETLHGAKTAHYTGTISVAAAAAKLKGGVAKAAVAKLADSGVKDIPVEVYLDDQGRLRRLKEHVVLTVKGTTADVTTSFDFYDFGTKVDVQAPPASQTKDGAPILAALKAQLG
jgi:hypothetical protein